MKNGMEQIWKYLAAGIMGLLALLLAVLSCSEKKNTGEEIPDGYGDYGHYIPCAYAHLNGLKSYGEIGFGIEPHTMKAGRTKRYVLMVEYDIDLLDDFEEMKFRETTGEKEGRFLDRDSDPGGYILCNRFSGVSVTSSADFNGIPAGEGDPVVHRHAVCVKGLADDEPVCPVLGEHFPETFVDDVDERSRYWRDPSRERGNAFHSAHVRFRAAVDGLSASATKGLARIERRHRDFPDEPPGIGPGQRHRLRASVTPENGIVARRRKQEQGESFRKAAFAAQPASFFWRTKANIWP